MTLNILLDIWTLYTLNIYSKYRLSDMSNLKLGGKYKVGFKRFKSKKQAANSGKSGFFNLAYAQIC